MSELKMKIVLLGQPTVGKTSLIHRFVENIFEETDSTQTIGLFKKNMTFNSTDFEMNIFDLAGMERFDSLAPIYYRNAQVIIFAFDSTKAETFASIEKWLKLVLQDLPNHKSVILALAATKCDLSEETQTKPKKVDVEKLAKEYNAELFETSSKNNTNVDKLFIDSARKALPFCLANNQPSIAPSIEKAKKAGCCS